MSKRRVFVADDHPIVRGGLRGLIDAQPDMETAGEAVDGATTVGAVLALRPDVVVMDVTMPGLGGAEATEQIRRECPDVKVVALTAHEGQGYLQRLLAAGAHGYVLKRTAAEELVRAIRAVAAGQTYLDPAVAGYLVARLTRSHAGASGAELSEREAEVLRMVARGQPTKEIASALQVGPRTVDTYKARGMEKLGLKSRADIVRYAVQQGWFSAG